MSPALAGAVAEVVKTRSTAALRKASLDVPPDRMAEYCEFLVLVAYELAKLGSSMTAEVLGLRLELKGSK